MQGGTVVAVVELIVAPFLVERQSKKDEEEKVVTSVALVIPKKGRKVRDTIVLCTVICDLYLTQAKGKESSLIKNMIGLATTVVRVVV